MLLRRVILILLLVALAVCAGAGMLLIFVRIGRQFEAIIAAAITLVIGMAVLLPLTFLVDRPKFRLGGVALMIAVSLALVCVLGLCLVGALPHPYRYELEDSFLIALGFASFVALPAAGALLLDRFAWARIAVRVLGATASFALVFGALACITARMPPYHLSEQFGVGAAMAAFLGLLAGLLLLNVGQGDKRYFRFPILALIPLAALLGFFHVLSRFRLGAPWNETLCVLLVVIAFFAHANLLLMAKVKLPFAWIRWLTMAASANCGLHVFLAVLFDGTDLIVGIALASGIAALCGSLALAVVALLSRRFDYRAEATPSTVLKELSLTCPRCQKGQTLPLGDSVCCQCGLKFSIRATEPQCLECGYLLYGITTPRCPECGAPTPTSNSAPAVATAPVRSLEPEPANPSPL